LTLDNPLLYPYLSGGQDVTPIKGVLFTRVEDPLQYVVNEKIISSKPLLPDLHLTGCGGLFYLNAHWKKESRLWRNAIQ